MTDQNQWLVRTARNWIAGPYQTEEVRKMILDGRLGIEDEVCPSLGYWTYLHERHEIQKLLGIEVPRPASAEDDVTETQILPSDKTGSVHGVSEVSPELGSVVAKGLHGSGASAQDSTPSGFVTAFSEAPPTKNFVQKVHVMGIQEKFSIARGIFWLLLGLGFVLLVAFVVNALKI